MTKAKKPLWVSVDAHHKIGAYAKKTGVNMGDGLDTLLVDAEAASDLRAAQAPFSKDEVQLMWQVLRTAMTGGDPRVMLQRDEARSAFTRFDAMRKVLNLELVEPLPPEPPEGTLEWFDYHKQRARRA